MKQEIYNNSMYTTDIRCDETLSCEERYLLQIDDIEEPSDINDFDYEFDEKEKEHIDNLIEQEP